MIFRKSDGSLAEVAEVICYLIWITHDLKAIKPSLPSIYYCTLVDTLEFIYTTKEYNLLAVPSNFVPPYSFS